VFSKLFVPAVELASREPSQGDVIETRMIVLPTLDQIKKVRELIARGKQRWRVGVSIYRRVTRT
jgi:hypothetical protein